jgi:hypothetical protein
MFRALRDPRVRVLLAVAVVALACALSLHLVAMGLHGMAMMLGLCLAVLGWVAVLVDPRGPMSPIVVGSTPVPVAPRRDRIEPIGRHPPDEGIRLRH